MFPQRIGPYRDRQTRQFQGELSIFNTDPRNPQYSWESPRLDTRGFSEANAFVELVVVRDSAPGVDLIMEAALVQSYSSAGTLSQVVAPISQAGNAAALPPGTYQFPLVSAGQARGNGLPTGVLWKVWVNAPGQNRQVLLRFRGNLVAGRGLWRGSRRWGRAKL